MTVYRPLMQHASRIIFGNLVQRELWIDRYGLSSKRCQVIYNGIDVHHFAPRVCQDLAVELRRRIGVREEQFIIGTVGQLRPEKNQAELISALALVRDVLPQARLVIAGEGPGLAELEAAAASLGIRDRVVFLGQVKDVRPVLELMDVFVLPSISETFSNAALEAMAMQKPVILTDVSGAREMITDGLDGLLYRQGDLQRLVTLLGYLAGNPAKRDKLARQARHAAVTRFSASRMVDDYQQLVLS